jgi:hypothetical protein
MEGAEETGNKSGSLLTWKDNSFKVLKEDAKVMDDSQRKKLLDYSIGLCKDLITV